MTVVAKVRAKMPARSYATWEAAKAASPSYDDEAVNAFRVARSKARVPDGSLLMPSLLDTAVRRLGKPDPIITDFGGATGELGRDLLRDFPHAIYTVVENPTLVRMMRGRGDLRFTTEIPPCCDIFFSSGTLQCIDDPLAVLKAGLASARHMAVMVRNSFGDRERFRCNRSHLFAHGDGPIPEGWTDRLIRYPHRTIIEEQVLEIARASGFACIRSRDEDDDAIPGDRGRQLIFERIHDRMRLPGMRASLESIARSVEPAIEVC